MEPLLGIKFALSDSEVGLSDIENKSSPNNVNSDGGSKPQNVKRENKEKVNAILQRRRKEEIFLDKIGLKPEEKNFSSFSSACRENQKSFSSAKAIEKVLNKNGISLSGTKTAAVKFNEKKLKDQVSSHYLRLSMKM